MYSLDKLASMGFSKFQRSKPDLLKTIIDGQTDDEWIMKWINHLQTKDNHIQYMIETCALYS